MLMCWIVYCETTDASLSGMVGETPIRLGR